MILLLLWLWLLVLLLLLLLMMFGITVKAEVLGCVVLVLRVYQLGSVIFVEGRLSSISI